MKRSWVMIAGVMAMMAGWALAEEPGAARERATAQTELAIIRLSQNHDVGAAKEGLKKAMEADSTYAMPLWYLGQLAEREEKWGEARGDYEKFATLDDKSEYYVKSQLRLDAVKGFEEMDKTEEGRKKRLYEFTIGNAKRELESGKPEEAITSAKRAREMDALRWESYAIEGAARAKLKDWIEAAKILQAGQGLASGESRDGMEKLAIRCEGEGKAEGLIKEAKAAVEGKNNVEAGAKYEEAFKLMPEHEEWGMDAALAYGAGEMYANGTAILEILSGSKNERVSKQAKENLAALGSLLQAQQRTFQQILTTAQNGNSTAQLYLGVLYQYGRGVKKNLTQAAVWYRKAAEQGSADAQNHLGIMCQNGLGVEKNYAKAVAWYRKAAEQGFAYAQNNLGFMYTSGQGVEKDYAQAAAWCQKAAEQGYVVAQSNLGAIYENGWGVEKDLTQAVAWYRKAAGQNDPDAIANLQRLKATGVDVGK